MGRAADGNFVLTKFGVKLLLPGEPAKEIELHNAQADFSQPRFEVGGALKGLDTTGWAVARQTDRAHTAVFETKQPLAIPAGARLEITLDHQYAGKGRGNYTLAKFRRCVNQGIYSRSRIALHIVQRWHD